MAVMVFTAKGLEERQFQLMVCLAAMRLEGGCIPLAELGGTGVAFSFWEKMPRGLCPCWFVSSRLPPTTTPHRHTTCTHLCFSVSVGSCIHTAAGRLHRPPCEMLVFLGDEPLGLLPLAHWASHCFQVPISTNALVTSTSARRFLSSLEVDSQHGMLGLMTPVTRSHAL